jgi:hypothetical protein
MDDPVDSPEPDELAALPVENKLLSAVAREPLVLLKIVPCEASLETRELYCEVDAGKPDEVGEVS